MRVTVHMPDELAERLRAAAANEKKSVSRLVAEAVAWYLREKRRRALGERVLERIGRSRIAPNIFQTLEEGRRDDRRP